MFELKPCDPVTFRQQTRRSTLIIAVLFVALAMLLSSLAVMLFGEPAFCWATVTASHLVVSGGVQGNQASEQQAQRGDDLATGWGHRYRHSAGSSPPRPG